MAKLLLFYGPPVAGERRFPRPLLEQRFLRSLTSSAGVKMFGLRRIGKSTLRLLAMETFEAAGKPYAFIDGQGLHSLDDLLARLFQELPSEKSFMNQALSLLGQSPAKAVLEALAKGSDGEKRALAAYWRLVSEAIRKSMRSPGPKPVLIIDEFSFLIENMIKRDEEHGRDDAEKLLSSMRQWRDEGMIMLLTGSIGFTALARRYGLNHEHINDLQPFPIPELTAAEAEDFVHRATEEPSKGRWTNEHTAEFLRQSGVLYPSFLVRGLIEIGVENPPVASDFAAIFAERIRPDFHSDFFNQFDRRFKAYAELPKDERGKLILPTLKAIFSHEGDIAQEELPCEAPFTGVELGLALTILQEDGFIHFTEDADGKRIWKPASRLAKLWWKRANLA